MKKAEKKHIDVIDEFRNCGRDAADKIIAVLESQQEKIEIDTYSRHKDEVVNGLFFRVFRFYHSFLISFHFWAADISEMTYRTMLESLFYLKFLTHENKEDLYKEFVKYGIGQEKLFKAHLGTLLDEKKVVSSPELIDYINSGSDDEIWDELISIKLSNFENLNKLAEKIDSKYDYTVHYQPYSITEHGQWPALKRFYLKRCKNPLHRYHFIGNARLPYMDLSFLFSTSNLFYDAYLIWIKTYGLPDEVKSIIDEYAECVGKIKKPEEKNPGKK